MSDALQAPDAPASSFADMTAASTASSSGSFVASQPPVLRFVARHTTPLTRKAMRRLYVFLNVFVFAFTIAVFVTFMKEIKAEDQAVRSTPAPAPPRATIASVSRPPSEAPANATRGPSPHDLMSWRERYVLLARHVFGDDYRGWIDIYFVIVIAAALTGCFGGLLRQRKLTAVSLALNLIVFGVTIYMSSAIASHRNNNIDEHADTSARLGVAVAWAVVSILVDVALLALGFLLAASMPLHKRDRYRVRRWAVDPEADLDLDEDEDDEDVALSSNNNLSRHTTDGSSTPAALRVAKMFEHVRRPRAESQAGAAAAAVGGSVTGTGGYETYIDDAAITEELPAGASRFTCHHVYDGDTLTLTTHQRVRLLGIETPEVKRRQRGAAEAQHFTEALCPAQRTLHVHCALPADHRLDPYGRLLGTIYATAPVPERTPVLLAPKYVNVNAALIAAGLATFYNPAAVPLPDEALLLRLQREAREARRGQWAEFDDEEVLRTAHGRCYHNVLHRCEAVAGLRHRVQPIRRSEALDIGLSACRSCAEQLVKATNSPVSTTPKASRRTSISR
jgi:endonuclease YncB( thermonuclease family)